MPKPETVVDYDAWNRGYMPPPEHILIDQLSYRGARVYLSFSASQDHQVWVVVKGPELTNKQRAFIRQMAELWFEDKPEEPAPSIEAQVPVAHVDEPCKPETVKPPNQPPGDEAT